MSTFEKYLQKIPKHVAREVELRHRIALRLHELLREKRWLQRDLAIRLDMPESRVSYILKGEANLTLRTIARLEEVLACELINVPPEPHSGLKVSSSGPAHSGSPVSMKTER